MLAAFLTSRQALGRAVATVDWYADLIAGFTTWLATAYPAAASA